MLLLRKINTAMKKLGTYSDEFCAGIYVLLLEVKGLQFIILIICGVILQQKP